MNMVYVVEDNQVILEGVTTYLELSGFKVKPFSSLNHAREALRQTAPDMLILDVMLPDGDGFAFAKEVRQSREFPIMFLTARDSESDRILGFELGADDYIVKPFSPKELVMRVKAVIRRVRSSGSRSSCIVLQHLQLGLYIEIDRARHLLHIEGHPVQLTAAEWRIVEYLAVHASNVISREQILHHCLDYPFDVSDRIVDTHIKNIRTKLKSPLWIETVRGYGYRMPCEPEREQS